ncbi:aldo/keto reductase [Schleiferilactobacillus shenzhenensis]|uniref:IolS n=1 Tax=Schleiferilactobacillus shenzhenensis LY-73 TaxID=1231336 RepID=U4TU05_9LACO|nr:aldo/keto reductase [Schleiferilactobacillus shenzhenensis]ERL65348.1 IolS [Schleiferilactobacillus shenzhenensis LY-73]
MAKTVTIGKSDVTSMPLGLGTNKVGGHNLFPDLDDKQGAEVVRTALDNGIQMLDTAFRYGNGRSEEIIGQVLKDYDRHQVVLATKASHDPAQNMAHNNRPEFLKKAVDDALLRLQTDYIDVFYIHFPDEDTPKYEAVGALEEAREAGKIRAIGVSNFSLDQIKEANQDGYVDIVEGKYSLIHRNPEAEEFAYLKANHISFVPYEPLALGLLTGKYQADQVFQKGDWQFDHDPVNFGPERFKKNVAAIDQIRPIAQAHHTSLVDVFLAWYLANPNVSVVIPGARKPEQVVQNIKALDVRLSPAEYQTIANAFPEAAGGSDAPAYV